MRNNPFVGLASFVFGVCFIICIVAMLATAIGWIIGIFLCAIGLIGWGVYSLIMKPKRQREAKVQQERQAEQQRIEKEKVNKKVDEQQEQYDKWFKAGANGDSGPDPDNFNTDDYLWVLDAWQDGSNDWLRQYKKKYNVK